jgi:uncharacterized protein YjbI with pentapeptide repeats
MAYLAVTLGGVTHADLLLNNDTTLPFVNVKVQLATFFVMAPLAFVLVHFSLLLQHVMLSRKLGAFEARVAKEEPSEDRGTQHIRDELHSYTFTQVASGKPKGAVVDMAQRLVVSLSLVVFPLLLLTFFQIGFLPYHSEPITWWHRGMLALDAAVVWLLARHLARLDPISKFRLTDWWHATSRFKSTVVAGWHRALDRASSALVSPTSPGARLARPLFAGARRGGGFVIRSIAPTRLVIAGLILFSTCVATLPDDPLDKATAWVARNWLPSLSEPLPYCRDILDGSATPKGEKGSGQKNGSAKEGAKPEARAKYKKECPKVTAATRRAFFATAYLFEHAGDVTSGKSDNLLGWSRNLIVTDKDLVDDDKKEGRLSLRGRGFRYATLDGSDLKHADFYGAKLAGARLTRANLNAADFRMASLQGADFSEALLQGADFSRVHLQGVNLFAARLQGADFFEAHLQGAGLFAAWLQGANLRMARLDGAFLAAANLQGADLTRAWLQAADLRDVKLQGARLDGARLQGADLRRTQLQGADLRGVNLHGADLREARLWKSKVAGETGERIVDDGRTLVSFAQVQIHPLSSRERDLLGETIAGFERVQATMRQERARERIESAAKNVAATIGALLETRDDESWRRGADLARWCKLARQPLPNPTQLARYLGGTLACEDVSDKAHVAQSLIRRMVSPVSSAGREPSAFLEAFKGCPAFDRIPADLKSQLERAARNERDNPAKPADANAPAPAPELPEACASLAGTPATAEPAKP